jgi:colanic acid biosynthesis glycosyl transferase WcaI
MMERPRLRVALVSINYAPDRTGIGVYVSGLARHLASRGMQVDVYTAFPYYPHWRKPSGDEGRLYRAERDGAVRVRRHYLYVPSSPSALRRMVHEVSFVASASLGYLLGPRADVTMVTSPPLPLGLPIGLIARLKGSPCVFHVQDLQPDAAIELGLLKPGLLSALMYRVEHLTYRICRRVATISHAMRDRIVAKGIDPQGVWLLRNWADDDVVSPRDRGTPLRSEWGLAGRHVVLYAGNLGVKQGIDMLLAAAQALRGEPDIAFVIVGDGGEKPRLERRAAELGLDNVQFRPLQPRERLAELLASADVSVIPQRAGATDIVLPSKLGNILASGRPLVVSAAESSELGRLALDRGIALRIDPGSAEQLAAAVLRLRSDAALCASLAGSGLAFMRTTLARDAVLPEFERRLLELAGREPAGRETRAP